MKPKRVFVSKSNWWSVLVPDEWEVIEDGHCATLHAGLELGTLQISAARKGLRDVTPEELREFARDRESQGSRLTDIEYSAFLGIFAEYDQEGRHWVEWWLRSSELVLYVTFIVGICEKATARTEVESILNSLRTTPRIH
jgi:hypothetical protein